MFIFLFLAWVMKMKGFFQVAEMQQCTLVFCQEAFGAKAEARLLLPRVPP
jgi:hypothetical protein